MADENEFLLSLVGALDETKTKENVQNALDRISKNVSLKSNSKTAKAITVFDKEQLEKDGIAYLKSVKDIESQLSEMFKGIGTNFSIKKTFADDGSISKFVATIYEGTKAIQTLNFEATKFSDKTFGFRQVGGTATSDKFTTKITSEIELLKAETEQIDLQEVFLTRLNQAKQMLNDGSISSDSLKFGKLNEDIRLLENQIKSIDFSKIGIEGEEHLNAVTDATLKAVEAEHKLYNTTMNKKTGVFNIPALEKEGISFYKNTVGVVEQVKQELEAKGYTPKISILGRDSEGAVTSFTAQIKNASGVIDNLYYDLVKLTDGEKEFYGFMSSYGKQIDNTSQEYAKALSDQTKKLSKARTDLDDLMTKFLTGNGNKVLAGDERSNDILNKLTEAETIINRLNSNAGRNTPEEIDGVIKLISQIKKEADEYVNLENKQKQITSEYEKQSKTIADLETKFQSLKDKAYVGGGALKDPFNIEETRKSFEEVSKLITDLKSKHGADTILDPKELDVVDNKLKVIGQDISVFKDMEALVRNDAKNQELQTEAYRKQSKVIQQYLLDVKKIQDTALNPTSGKRLLNPDDIKATSLELSKVQNILNAVMKGQANGAIIPQKTFDEIDIRLKKLHADISLFSDQDTINEAMKKTAESQLNALDRVSNKIKDIKLQYQDGFVNEKSFIVFNSSVKEVEDELSRLGAKAGNITESEIRNLNNLVNELKRTTSVLYENEKEQARVTAEYDKQSKKISDLESRLQDLRNKTFIGKGALTDKSQLEEMTADLHEVYTLINKLKTDRGNNTILNQAEFDAVDSKLKDIGQNLSVFKEIDALMRQDKKSVEDQTKSLNALDQKLKDIRSKYSRGSNQLFDLKNVRDVELLITNAENEINRLLDKAGKVTPEEAMSLQNRLSTLQRIASERLDIEKTERKSLSDAEKTAQVYEKQKYTLASLKQDVQKLSDSAFKGKNPFVDEKNISDAEIKLKSLNTFIDGLYTKHNMGDIIPEDAFNRFDLKIKEVTQDFKNMKDEESLQKSLAGNIESQTDALNRYDQKLKDIVQKYSSGGNQLFNDDHIKKFRVSVLSIENELDRLGGKLGNITAEESRSLSNMFSELQRTATGFVDMEKAERKEAEIAEKNAKAYSNQSLKLIELEQAVRAIVDSSLSGSKKLIDPNNIEFVEGKLKSINTFINGMFSGHVNGKLIPDEVFDKAELQLKELRQDIVVFKDEETLIKNATKSMEAQLTTLNNYEQKAKSIRQSYLTDKGDNQLINSSNISDLESKLTSLENRISSMRNTTATNNEATYRELTNEYNEAVRLAQGYAHVEKEQQKHITAVEKQKNQLLDYKRGIDDLYNLNLDPSVKGALKNAKNIYAVNKSITDLRSELQVLIDNNNNGLEITNERMNQFGQSYKNLTSQVTYARGREGLEAMDLKNAQAQINKFAEMERSLDSFRAKYYGDGSPTRLTDSMHIDETVDKINVLNDMVSKFKTNAGNISDTQINEYKNLRNELDIVAQRYANLEAIQKKDTQTIEDQKYVLNAYNLEMEKIRKTTLNPDSALTLTNSDDIQKITDNFTKLEQKYQELRSKNNNNILIDKGELKETDLLLKEIYQDINIISKEDSSKNDFNNSLIKTKANLNLLIGDLERDGKLVGNIRTQITDFVVELSKIKSPEELDNFNARLTAFRTNFIDLQRDERAAFDNENLQQKLQILSSQVNGYINQNTRAAVLFKSSFDELQNGIRNASTPQDLVKLQNEFKLLQQNINNAGKAGQTFGERMSGAVKKFMMWTGMTNTVMYLIRSIKQMVTNVKELDNAMVSLKKVTDETDVAYSRIFDEATNKAKELNTSIKNIINSTAEFAKLGFDTEQAQSLAEVANVYANVAEIDVDTASKTLVSTINGFKDLTEENAWDIADVINNISNKFAASGADLGDILQRSSAALSEANNDLNESIALGTVAQTINVDASRVGTALKTLSLRIRGATMELEKEGLDTEDMAKTTADLRRYVLAAAGVDILEKDQKTFKSTYQILLEISKVWENIGDLERAALLQKLGGKMQANIVSSILNNGELLEKVYEEAQNSAGSAMQEQNRWAESLEAKAGKIEAVFESISSKVLDSESLKKVFDSLAGILELIDGIVGKGKGLTLLGSTLGGILGGSGNGFINLNSTIGYWKEAKKMTTLYNKELAINGVNAAKAYAASVQEINPAMSEYLIGLNGAEAGTKRFGLSMVAAGVKATTLKVIVTALNAALNALIFAGIGIVISKFTEAANENERLNRTLAETSEQLNNNLSDLDDYKKKIDEIIDSDKTETEKLDELKDIKDEIHKKYQTEIDDIKDTTQAREALIDAIKEEKKQQLTDYVNSTDNKKAYDEAKRRINDSYVSYSAPEDMGLFDFSAWKQLFFAGIEDLKDEWNGIAKNKIGEFSFLNTDGSDLDISDDIVKLFDNSLSEVIGGNDAFTFSIDYNGDEADYFKKLTTLYNAFSDLRQTRVGDLNEDEEKLFQMVNYQYETLKKDNGDFIQGIEDMARATAQLMTMVTEQGDMSDDDYFTMLSKLTDDEYVIEALRDLIYQTDSLKESIENTSPAVSEMLSNLQKVSSSCKEISEEIDKADEQFDKLNKTLEDNKDVDKFFSASDIIEILELYPELNDAILETAYGYKIEESAIQELHDTKLAEKKADIQNKLDETQTLLDATTKKLSYYQNELKGIENVAKAKAKLVELEAKYASLGSNTTNPYYNNGALESEIAMLNDFINLSEESERLQKDIDKLSIENKVLGNSFDKAKDATENQTKALNDQKKAIDELKDGYDDAKKAIEDLIELTMAMLKKNAELTKEDLKEQLDGFKKLIDKRKELIDLEKQQYDFEKDLKEQNKDLLKIQQELDALSVEGVSYSLEDLKRKAELEEKVAEQKSKRDDFLYEHQVEVEKDALDKEQELFEDQINTQIKSIEDYLDHEGKIRAEAVDLINGKSQQFYDNLLDYTMNYTKKSRYEFDKLWQDAYDAILKYANGELNVELALINIINAMELAENQLKSIDAALNNIKNSTDDAKKAMYDFLQVTADTKAKLDEINNMPTKSAINYSTDPRFSDPEYAKLLTKQAILGGKNGKNAMDLIKQIRGYHTGGIVEGVSTQHGEVLAKLLSGEVVVTEKQARNFMENTLPKLATNTTTNNQSIAPVINIGDININGNADKDTVSQLNAVRQSIVDDVFKAVNRQNSTFNGMRPRFV